ncbi:MAG: hypothetical protein WDO24_25100 [Pseudomonadota bacterium]
MSRKKRSTVACTRQIEARGRLVEKITSLGDSSRMRASATRRSWPPLSS